MLSLSLSRLCLVFALPLPRPCFMLKVLKLKFFKLKFLTLKLFKLNFLKFKFLKLKFSS